MFRPIASPSVLASLLVGLTATAQAAAARSIVLTGQEGEAPLISVAPGTVTVLLLDAPLLRESVEVEGRARFAVLYVGDTIVTLSPTVALGPGERLALRVSYREGFPSSVVFLLTGQPGTVDEVVNVSRAQQPVEACRRELSATRERCEARSQELAALKARPPAVSPAAVVLAELVDKHGMRGKDFARACRNLSGELHVVACRGLGASRWSVVILEVSNTGKEPWAPGWAEVSPATGGERRRARAVLSGAAHVLPGATARVAVEVEMPARKPKQWLSELHALRVCSEDGLRCLAVTGVEL
ncbi:DUF2381 family protein [Hyalangium gracile]|uniref:DUF2381 family protein n=1 Tax=Hyalangium gracile TaxID=394092 RepID=UPI001CCCBD48|nr:DUF2381 family protein [Hyalangium gracile]